MKSDFLSPLEKSSLLCEKIFIMKVFVCEGTTLIIYVRISTRNFFVFNSNTLDFFHFVEPIHHLESILFVHSIALWFSKCELAPGRTVVETFFSFFFSSLIGFEKESCQVLTILSVN